MFKSILIISDNVFLCTEFNKLLAEEKLPEISWDFAVSQISKISLFESALTREIRALDLKNSQTIESIIKKYDLVFSIHCKQIFPPDLVNSVKCINIHPGYNPINRGWYPQVFALIYNLPVGATIHEIDEKLDHGKIIDRELVNKTADDTSESLYKKIIKKEIELLKKNLKKIILNEYNAYEPENDGNIYLKSDFNKLQELKLDEKVMGHELINTLRALSHGNFKNAFFIDKISGKKVYVSINLEIENE
jgi:methionyl-tRNA formyltransferase